MGTTRVFRGSVSIPDPETMHMKRLIRTAVVLVPLAAAGPAGAGACLTYDAALGTTPVEQGWTESSNGVASVSVAGGQLDCSTLPFSDGACPTPSEPNYVNWRLDEVGLDFADEPVVEARLRITSSQYGTNGCNGWARPGFMLFANATDGRTYRVGFGSGQIFLTNGAYLVFGDPGVVETSFDTTDGFHDYRLEMSDTGAVLRIDGAEVLSVPAGVPIGVTSAAGFGDPTVWANSAVAVQRVRITSSACCPADLDGDGDVGVPDLLSLLAAWGTNGPGADLVAPVDVVDVGDLLELLAGWGSCG